MISITNVKIIRHFVGSNGVTYGLYQVTIDGNDTVIVRNGNSVGVVQFYVGRPAGECVSEMTDSAKQIFLSELDKVMPLDRCKKCGQLDIGQTGEYPCSACGLPTAWDQSFADTLEKKAL